MQGEPHSGDIHMENARTSLQSLARFSWPGGQRNFKGELAQAQTVRAEGNDSLGTRGAVVLLIKPNQIKPFWLLGPVQIGELRSVRSGWSPRVSCSLGLGCQSAQDS